MKRAANLILIALLTGLSLTTAFAGALRTAATPVAAAEASNAVQSAIRSFERKGYTMQETNLSQRHYLIAPEGDYIWGEVHFVLTQKPFENSLTTNYATVTVSIMHHVDSDTYSAKGHQVNETTVF